MGLIKRVEQISKLLLALLSAALLWRPGRRRKARARLERPQRILLVRIDNRVGEALLTTPLLTALRRGRPSARIEVLVHARAARVLEGHPAVDRVLPFDRRWLFLGPLAPGVRALRKERFDLVVNCGNWEVPSVTSAILSRLLGRVVVIGPAVWPTGLLADVPVPALRHTPWEVAQRQHLLSPLGLGEPVERLSFRAPRPRRALGACLEEVRSSPHAVVNPGGRLGYRRIPPSAFAAAARALVAVGRRPLVTWGPGEEALAREVVEGAPGAVLAPATDLDDLAALMAAAQLTVCNNTGPMHLSVAVGAPTLGLFFRVPMERWGHFAPPHRMVDLTPVVDGHGDLGGRVADEVARFAKDAERSLSALTSAAGLPR